MSKDYVCYIDTDSCYIDLGKFILDNIKYKEKWNDLNDDSNSLKQFKHFHL